MAGSNGDGKPTEEVDMVRQLAAILAGIESLKGEMRDSRHEIKNLGGRVEGLASEIRTSRSIVDQLGEKVHRNNNLMTRLTNEVSELYQSRMSFERATVKIDGLLKMQDILERSLDVVEGRVGAISRVVADLPTDVGEPGDLDAHR